MKIKHALIWLLMAAVAYSCDDSTTSTGGSIIAAGDSIPAGAATYSVTTRSILADSIYARTNTAYLGKYTDPQYGEFTADFIAQFTCPDNFEFPEHTQDVKDLSLTLSYLSFFGDSTNSMRLQIDTLSQVIPEGNLLTFYTSIDPATYCNPSAKPIARKAYAATGASVRDTLNPSYDSYGNVSGYYKIYSQTIKLPVSLGQHMYDKYKEDKNNFKDAEQFIKNVLKGFYIHCTHGDGTILYIDDMQLQITVNYLTESSSGKVDSLISGYKTLAATKEVIQANRFKNSDRLKELAENPECTYIKTPAGIFTEVTLPIEEIAEVHQRDTLNAASITFTRYNEKSNGKYAMDAPEYLLMVRKKDMYTFFEENKMYDSQTSFVAQYIDSGESANTYTFSNIAQLLTYCINEKDHSDPDWNKVVLIPVSAETSQTSDGSTYITSVSNNLGLESATLKGGTQAGHDLKMQVLYTKFYQEQK